MRRLPKDALAASLLLLLPALVGVVLLARATRWGIGITPDSVVYLEAAEHLARGDGLVSLSAEGRLEPLRHYAPLYPALLGALAAAGAEPERAARGLALLLCAANALLVAAAVRAASPGARVAPLLGAWLTASCGPLLWLHALALSDALFLALATGGLLALGRALDAGARGPLVASGALLALASLDRYAGASLLPAAALALLWLGPGSARRRAARAACFAAAVALPLGAWLLAGLGAPGGPVGRALAFHPIDAGRFELAAERLSGWLLLEWLPPAAAGALLAALAAALLALALRAPGPAGRRAALRRRLGAVPAVFALFAVSYAVFLGVSLSFVDAYTALNARILAPLFPALAVVLLRAAGEIVRAQTGLAVRAAAAALAAVFAVCYGHAALAWSARAAEGGVGPGYGTRAWRGSTLIEQIRALPAEAPLYSNGPDAIRFLARRPAHWLPLRSDPVGARMRGDFREQLRRMRRDLEHGGGFVAWIDELSWRRYVLSRGELEQLPLRRLATHPKGSLYGAR